MKKMLKVIGVIILFLAVLIAALFYFIAKSPSVPENYTETVKTGGEIEAKYLAIGSYEVEHLESTHYNFYETVRKAQPSLPILMISKPDFDGNFTKEAKEYNARRRAVIQATYDKARKNGDKNVYFIDGETLFGTEDRESCTSDLCHPNDLGFYRMANVVTPVVEKILKKA